METIINDSIEFLLYEIMIFPFQICLIAFLIYTAYLGILDYQYKTITKGTLIGLSIITFIQLINDFYSHYHRYKDVTIFKFCPASYFGNVIISILIAIALYVIGELLSASLTNLSNIFRFPEIILGILLGVITSIPELITFIEAQRKEKSKNSEEANKLGVIEATNNLLTSNILNLFVIQSIGILIYTIFE